MAVCRRFAFGLWNARSPQYQWLTALTGAKPLRASRRPAATSASVEAALPRLPATRPCFHTDFHIDTIFGSRVLAHQDHSKEKEIHESRKQRKASLAWARDQKA
jgi:hypothetical protein